MAKLTKKQKKTQEIMADFQQPASILSAIEMLQKVAKETSKFNETVECHIRLGLDVKHADQQVRGTATLPAGLGKVVRVAVIAKGAKLTEAEQAGADIFGTEDLIEKIQGGFLEFDKVIATPDCMGMLGKVAKKLGPRGLMPNPKTGTVTLNIAQAVTEAKSGKVVEFRAIKQPMIQVPIGKIQFTAEDLMKNFATLAETIIKLKPSSAKGTYIRSIYLTTTMGPSIKLNTKDITNEIKDYLV